MNATSAPPSPPLADPQDARPWHVLLVEDDPDTADFFAASLARHARLRVAGRAASMAEALDWLADASHPAPDVLLTDLALPDGSGLRIIADTLDRHPGCDCLVISMFGDEESVLESIRHGAVGYIHKDALPADIAATVLDMKRGASPISPMIARRVLAAYRLQTAPADPPAPPPPAVPMAGLELSAREQSVLSLIARGFSYRETADLLAISVSTVQTHVKNLYRKLAVHSKNEAVFEAMRQGLLPAPPVR